MVCSGCFGGVATTKRPEKLPSPSDCAAQESSQSIDAPPQVTAEDAKPIIENPRRRELIDRARALEANVHKYLAPTNACAGNNGHGQLSHDRQQLLERAKAFETDILKFQQLRYEEYQRCRELEKVAEEQEDQIKQLRHHKDHGTPSPQEHVESNSEPIISQERDTTADVADRDRRIKELESLVEERNRMQEEHAALLARVCSAEGRTRTAEEQAAQVVAEAAARQQELEAARGRLAQVETEKQRLQAELKLPGREAGDRKKLPPNEMQALQQRLAAAEARNFQIEQDLEAQHKQQLAQQLAQQKNEYEVQLEQLRAQLQQQASAVAPVRESDSPEQGSRRPSPAPHAAVGHFTQPGAVQVRSSRAAPPPERLPVQTAPPPQNVASASAVAPPTVTASAVVYSTLASPPASMRSAHTGFSPTMVSPRTIHLQGQPRISTPWTTAQGAPSPGSVGHIPSVSTAQSAQPVLSSYSDPRSPSHTSMYTSI